MNRRHQSLSSISLKPSAKSQKLVFPSFSSSSTSITSVIVTQKPEVRTWLRTHGKRQYIGFDDEERIKLRKYFSSLDENNNGRTY